MFSSSYFSFFHFRSKQLFSHSWHLSFLYTFNNSYFPFENWKKTTRRHSIPFHHSIIVNIETVVAVALSFSLRESLKPNHFLCRILPFSFLPTAAWHVLSFFYLFLHSSNFYEKYTKNWFFFSFWIKIWKIQSNAITKWYNRPYYWMIWILWVGSWLVHSCFHTSSWVSQVWRFGGGVAGKLVVLNLREEYSVAAKKQGEELMKWKSLFVKHSSWWE